MGNDSLALNKIIAGLHARILEKDVTAHVELAELLLPILTKKLSKVFPNVYDKDFIDIAVTDALLNYFDDPSKYLSEKRSLTGYLLMSAKGDLLNQLKGRKIDHATLQLLEDVELDDSFTEENIGIVLKDDVLVENEIIQRLSPVWPKIEELFPDLIDQEIAKLIIEDVRETEPFALILGISHLSMEEQRAIVKRHKDKVKKKILRNFDPKELRGDV